MGLPSRDVLEHDKVRVLEERGFDPPRPVLVEHEGRWWRGWQSAWRLCDDTRGWMAEVSWTADHKWVPGSYSTMVRPEQVRAQGGQE